MLTEEEGTLGRKGGLVRKVRELSKRQNTTNWLLSSFIVCRITLQTVLFLCFICSGVVDRSSVRHLQDILLYKKQL